MTLAGGLGVFREHPTKLYPDRDGGELLTADELAVWRYVQHLEAELKAAREQLADKLAVEIGSVATGADGPKPPKGKK